MVVGNGFIAKAFEPWYSKDNGFLIFASGVSNSGNTEASEFDREANLLEQTIWQHPEKTLVYFSTCSIYDPSMGQSPYVKHKLAMEAMIQARHSSYHIFRLANLAGKTDNPHTFLNYFAQHIQSGSFFYLWKHAWRNVMDVADLVTIGHHILQQGLYKNEVVNIVNPASYKVVDIVNIIETVLQKKGNYEVVDKTSKPEIDTNVVRKLVQELQVEFGENYLYNIIHKYYAPA
jgi:nucleoside-diphosphate-sugar epimerase